MPNHYSTLVLFSSKGKKTQLASVLSSSRGKAIDIHPIYFCDFPESWQLDYIFFFERESCYRDMNTWVFCLKQTLLEDLAKWLKTLFASKHRNIFSPKKQGVGGMIAAGGYQPRHELEKNCVKFYT